jgi:hypothetical protein
MPKKTSLVRFRTSAQAEVTELRTRLNALTAALPPASIEHIRWVAHMTAVELHVVWERYAEGRLVIALNHFPTHFLTVNSVRGVKILPVDLADYLVRGGAKYFDFRSIDDLIDKGKRLLAPSNNPFAAMGKAHKEHLDALAALRNYVVHKSESSRVAYKRHLAKVFGIKSAPSAGEFLDSIDHRNGSPCKGQKRIFTFFHYVNDAISSF